MERERERERREYLRTHFFLKILLLSVLPEDVLLNSILIKVIDEVFTESTSVSGSVSLFFSRNPSATYFT